MYRFRYAGAVEESGTWERTVIGVVQRERGI